MDYNYISTKKCRSNFLRRPQHWGRRSLAGLESVTLRPFPLTSVLVTLESEAKSDAFFAF